MTDYEKAVERINKLEEEVKEYCRNESIYILDRAMVSEVFYNYQYYVLNEEDTGLMVLELKHLIEIADRLLNEDYFNESMNIRIIDELFSYSN